MQLTRRRFITESVGAAVVAGCGGTPPRSTGGSAEAGPGDADPDPDPDLDPDPDGDPNPDVGPDPEPDPDVCDDIFAGGRMQEVLDWPLEPDMLFGRRRSQGWDGRLAFDLSKLEPGQANLTENHEFFIRTFYPDGLDPDAPWSIRVRGLVDAASEIDLTTIEENATDQGAFLLECSGNSWQGKFALMSSARWSGVPLADVLADLPISRSATRVLISGFDDHDDPSTHSTPGASWIFTLDEVESTGMFLATGMNGQPLPFDNGFPVRLYVPSYYGCSCIKWVDEIRFVDDDEPATPQMMEFATRTHQNGIPDMARDFLPAIQDQSAMPVRIERWRLADGTSAHRIIGIVWGGDDPTAGSKLTIRLGSEAEYVPVTVCPDMSSNQPWTVWTHVWRPDQRGMYRIRCGIDDRSIRTNRLDVGYYDRTVDVNVV